MNERLKLLADQAKATILTTHGMEHVVDGCYIIGPARLDKFALLIVKECIEEIKHLRMKYDTHRDVEPEENDRYIDAFLQAEVRLKELFGVEE